MDLAHALPLASALSVLHKIRKDAAPPAPAGATGDLTSGDPAAGGGLKAPEQAAPTAPTKPAKTVEYQGIPVHVDRPAGMVQKGVDAAGKEWTRVYHVDYGHVPGTRGGDEHKPEFGKDGQLDVYLGLMPDAPEAHWVIQKKDDGTFDEYKCMLGCVSAESAKALWNAHTPKRYFGGMTSTSIEMMKSLLGMRPAEAMKVLKALTGAEVAARMLADAAAVEKAIRQEADGWHVYSEDGEKHLGGPYGSKADAVERLRQVEGHKAKAEDAPAVEKAAGTIVLAELRKGESGEEIRYVLAPVLIPDVVDAQGDTYSKDEVRKAEWVYMKRYRNVGLMHKQLVNGRVDLVESYCAPTEMLVEGSRIAEGTWMMGLNVVDDALWNDVKSGRLTGLSIGGVATKTPVV